MSAVRRLLAFGALIAAGVVALSPAGRSVPPDPPARGGGADPERLPVEVIRDITYATVDGQKLQLDIAMPKEGGPYPGVVCFHGGAWRVGSRKELIGVIEMLAARGYVAATVSYRLAPKFKFPAQLEDARTAVRFLRANAKMYHLDPDHIGVAGYSAGAHLALLLGVVDKSAGLCGTLYPEESGRVQCVVSFFGPTDLSLYAATPGLEDAYMVPFLGADVKTNPMIYKRASPIEYVTRDDAPVLMIHGTFDVIVPIIHSERMLKKLQEAGVPAELITVPGEGHGWGGATMTRTLESAVQFLDKYLKGKK